MYISNWNLLQRDVMLVPKRTHCTRDCRLGAVQREGISTEAKIVYRKAVDNVTLRGTNLPEPESTTCVDTEDIKKKLRSTIKKMGEGLIERNTEIRLLLLGAISGEHVLLLGPPGTAKSELGRRLSQVSGGSYYERLLTKFSVPEELFGPLSMRALEEDRYVRQTDGYLPDSKVAFIDEIFKANSAILNTLLTMLNERLFDNGNCRVDIPLTCVVGASNELPDCAELDALYDRFLFRKKVNPISKQGFSRLISSLNSRPTGEEKNSEKSSTISWTREGLDTSHLASIHDDDIAIIRSEAVARVRVPREVVQLFNDVRQFLRETDPPIYVSDRRLIKAVNMLKVAAYTNGRLEISVFDCLLLQHCLWQKPEEHGVVLEFILAKLSSDEEAPNFEVIGQRIFARCCLVLTGSTEDKELHDDLTRLYDDVLSRLERITFMLSAILPALDQNLWIDAEEAASLSSVVVPHTNKTKRRLDALLLEIEILKIILEENKEPSICAELLGERWAEFLKTPLKLRNRDAS